jgi:tetratricopeptide (TPR) repeat protein
LAVPKSAQQQYNKAREAAMKGDYDVSFKSVRLALERYPHFPAALTLRGILRFERGNMEGAELDFQQAIVLSPNDVAAYTSLIGLYADLKRFDDARYCAQRALSLAPHAWFVHLQAGYLEYRTGHFDDTVKYVGQAERLLSADVLPPARAKLYILRGYALLELSRTTEARNDFERALRYSSPGSVYADVADKQLQRLQTYMSDGLGVAPTTK